MKINSKNKGGCIMNNCNDYERIKKRIEEERKKYIFAQLRSLPNATQYVEVTK